MPSLMTSRQPNMPSARGSKIAYCATYHRNPTLGDLSDRLESKAVRLLSGCSQTEWLRSQTLMWSSAVAHLASSWHVLFSSKDTGDSTCPP